MGGMVIRALTQRQRRMRIRPNNEQDLRQVMKIMCSSLFFLPLFALGFMTNTTDLNSHHFSSNIVIGIISTFIMNATNPSLCLIIGWIMVIIRSLFLSQFAIFFHNIACFLVTFSILTKLYDYFTSSSHTKYVFPSIFIFIAQLILQTGYCCSQLIKS